MKRARRYVIDIELDDEDLENFEALLWGYVETYSDNWDLSGGPSPADACYPHPVG